MRETKDLVLGIDTSNYTTSVSLTDQNRKVIRDERIPLRVKQGERGLRQSNALFQHQENLPQLLHLLLPSVRERIAAVSVSNRPRPVEGSYMPVFLAGCQTGQLLSDALGVPLFQFSHQEGHLKAASFESQLNSGEAYLAWHLSGGTCELLEVRGREIRILGGSLDISFGQLLDRLGVAMGLSFPCGRALDEMALKKDLDLPDSAVRLKPVSLCGLQFNVSGLETQAMRMLSRNDVSREMLICQVFREVSRCLEGVSALAVRETGIAQVLFTGGVSASGYLRCQLKRWGESTAVRPVFGEPGYASDNAVGTSLLGGEVLWD